MKYNKKQVAAILERVNNFGGAALFQIEVSLFGVDTETLNEAFDNQVEGGQYLQNISYALIGCNTAEETLLFSAMVQGSDDEWWLEMSK